MPLLVFKRAWRRERCLLWDHRIGQSGYRCRIPTKYQKRLPDRPMRQKNSRQPLMTAVLAKYLFVDLYAFLNTKTVIYGNMCQLLKNDCRDQMRQKGFGLRPDVPLENSKNTAHLAYMFTSLN